VNFNNIRDKVVGRHGGIIVEKGIFKQAGGKYIKLVEKL
jgi:hypothetical protein